MLAVCGRRRLFVRRAAERTACSMILAAEAPSLAAAWGMGTPEPRERICVQQQLGPLPIFDDSRARSRPMRPRPWRMRLRVPTPSKHGPPEKFSLVLSKRIALRSGCVQF